MPVPAHDSAGHDAQRELEHRALRNVRGLVDRMEADERAKGRSQKWIAAGLVALAVILIGSVIALISFQKPDEARELTVTPVSKAPAR